MPRHVYDVHIAIIAQSVNGVNMPPYHLEMEKRPYHHGDLRRAVVQEALDIARSGGADAISMRELGRRLGVSPSAIYRHFADRDALLAAVAHEVRFMLAERMLLEVERVGDAEPRVLAVRRFLATGRGYVRFATEEPRLLAIAFLALPDRDPRLAGDGRTTPWEVLTTALDGLVVAGVMTGERRAGAEVVAWSAVHGFAALRSSRAFLSTGGREPDEEDLLAGIVKALDLPA